MRRYTCKDCPHLRLRQIAMGGVVWTCSHPERAPTKDEEKIVPQHNRPTDSEGVWLTRFKRVPLECPLPSSVARKLPHYEAPSRALQSEIRFRILGDDNWEEVEA